MEKFNLKKESDFIIFETHREKANKKNRLKREILFLMQCSLNNLLEKRIKDRLFLKIIYLKAKEKYISM